MSNLADELKQMIIDVLALEDIRIEDIDTDAPLFGDGLGLDSIDAFRIGLGIEKTLWHSFECRVCRNQRTF